jgi:hypothetical protein
MTDETEGFDVSDEPAPTTRARSAVKRSSVPSWDEIVFGAARTDT